MVKKRFPLHPALILSSLLVLFFFSCKKLNEATLLGDDLVPEVDNIHTFDTTFEAEADNQRLIDTAKLTYGDPVALGNITNDPEFGQTRAAVYFQINPLAYGSYPFAGQNIKIDSVMLSLDYTAGYGDTNALQTVRVYEVAQSTTFNDTTYYPFNQPDFETTGAELGSKTFAMSQLKDSLTLTHGTDTTRVGKQLRIKLDDALGVRFASYDTTTGSNGGYNNDTLFKKLFRGFALKVDEGSGNGLGYFVLASNQTNLTIYYRSTLASGVEDTLQTVFTHALRTINNTTASKGGQVNSIKRQAGGGWASYLENGLAADDKLYLQSTPEGSAAYLKIPQLDQFQNKLVHRAELIAPRLSSTMDVLFTAPGQLFLDRVNATGDSAFVFPEFLAQNSTGGFTFNYTSFGGELGPDNAYHFNVTQVVQEKLAGRRTNPTLRIYAPFDTQPYNTIVTPAAPLLLQALPFPAFGRVVLAGGNYADGTQRLRLRIVYSNL